MTQITDEAGIEFILPVAKWRCFQGKANIYGRSFGNLTQGAALGALTRRMPRFPTVHVPLVTPAFGAKAIATIDHVTHGRAGLNIVCGWIQEEFDLHSVAIDRCLDGTFAPNVIASAPSGARRSSRRTAPRATERRRQCAPREAQSSMTSV
jgi:hypothetical protein